MDIELLTSKYCDNSLYMRGLSPYTIRKNRRLIDYYRRFAHVTAIDEVTEKNVREMFLNGRVHRNWKPSTFLLFYHSLNVFFKWCISNRYMTDNPMAGMELPRPQKMLPKNLSKELAMKLLEVVYNYPYDSPFLRYRNHAIFAMFMFAGLRRKELLKMKLADVDVTNLTIFVHQGKGNKDRIIPMNYTLAEILKRYLTQRKKLNKTCPEFFVSLNRNMGYTEHGLKRLVATMSIASGIKFTNHWLRHTFATLMHEGGCDLFNLSKLLGHSDIKTTMIYVHASAENLRVELGKHPLNDLVRFG